MLVGTTWLRRPGVTATNPQHFGDSRTRAARVDFFTCRKVTACRAGAWFLCRHREVILALTRLKSIGLRHLSADSDCFDAALRGLQDARGNCDVFRIRRDVCVRSETRRWTTRKPKHDVCCVNSKSTSAGLPMNSPTFASRAKFAVAPHRALVSMARVCALGLVENDTHHQA